MNVVGIYLAAGNSSRMRAHKLSLPLGTMTVGSLALETALKSSLDEIFVVTKETDNVDWIPLSMKSNEKCTIITCPTSHEGQAESLRCGIQKARDIDADAAVILLADQPFITIQMINGLVDCMKTNPTSPFVATTYDESIRPPVLFSPSMYTALMKLRGDKGARALLRSEFLHKGIVIPCTDAKMVFDVDTFDDYQKCLSYNQWRA